MTDGTTTCSDEVATEQLLDPKITLTIEGEFEADLLIARRAEDEDKSNYFTHLISIRGPHGREDEDPTQSHIKGWSQFAPENRVQLNFDDISHPSVALEEQGYVWPNDENMKPLFRFAAVTRHRLLDDIKAGRESAPIRLISYCAAGISRSTAAAYIFLTLVRGPGSELQSIADVFVARDFAQPNPLMIQIADWTFRKTFGGTIREVAEKVIARRKSARQYGSGY